MEKCCILNCPLPVKLMDSDKGYCVLDYYAHTTFGQQLVAQRKRRIQEKSELLPRIGTP